MWYNDNGLFVDNVSVDFNNRSFKYGDGLFESLRLFEGRIFNKESHSKRLVKSLDILQMTLNVSVSELLGFVELLALKNNLSKGSKARIIIYRKGAGLYMPDKLDCGFFIEISPSENQFSLNQNGLILDYYTQHLKSSNILSTIKSTSSIFYVLASIARQQKSVDDLLLLNNKNCIIESSNSNLFIVKDDKIITPPLSDGCLDGTMRSFVLDHFEVSQQSLFFEDILSCSELFLSNCNGIRWVKKLGLFESSSSFVSGLVVQKCNDLI